MFKKGKKVLSILTAATLMAGSLAGCGTAADNTTASETAAGGTTAAGSTASGETAKAPVTLSVLMNGDKPNDWDSVVEEFYHRTKDTLNIEFNFTWVSTSDYKEKLNVKMTAGEEYDLVFDAPWMHLRTLAQDDVYVDLAPYLHNDAYPGLKKAFPEELMEHNKYSDKNVAIPLFFTYTSMDVALYRQDWAKEFGIGENGQIVSKDELKQYMEKVKTEKPGVTPIALKDNRGFYRLFETWSEYQGQNIYQGSLGQDIFFAYKLNDEMTEVVGTAFPGDTMDHWATLGLSEDIYQSKIENQREWNQYTEVDSMNQKDPGALFQIGKAGAILDHIDAIPKFNRQLLNNVPEAELGVFIIDQPARDMQKGYYNAAMAAGNCLAIPASSKNVERTIEFLDWMFTDQANHDLFEYGIEGKHWEPVGEKQYKIPDGVSTATNYNPNGWNFSWNPLYYRFSEDYTPYTLQYAEYATQLDNFNISQLSGFVFQSDSVKTEIAQNGAILGEVLVPINHGVLDNPYQVMQDTTAKMRSNNVQKALDVYVEQLNTYLNK